MISTLRKIADQQMVEYSHARRAVRDEKIFLEEAQVHFKDAGEAQIVIQTVASEVQQIAHLRVANIVTKCIKAIFGEESYNFKIIFDRKRGKTEARLVYLRGDYEVSPCNAAGGGVLDISAFALRLACLVLSMPTSRKLLVLDEPFRHLAVSKSEKVAQMLRQLCEELGIQIVLITHNEELRVGKIVEIS